MHNIYSRIFARESFEGSPKKGGYIKFFLALWKVVQFGTSWHISFFGLTDLTYFLKMQSCTIFDGRAREKNAIFY